MTRYVIARNFDVAGDRTLYYGDTIPAEEIETWQNLQVLIASHYVYPVADDGSEFWLPSHLYTHVANIQIAKGLIERGEAPDMEVDWTKPAAVVRQEELIDMEAETRAQNARVSEIRARRSHAAFQQQQLSPRPIELPPEKIYLDSKHDEAMPTGMEHITEAETEEPPELEDSVDTVAEEEEAADAEVEEPEAEEDNQNSYTKAELQELAHSWNEEHPDDKVPVNTNKPELEAALSEHGVI